MFELVELHVGYNGNPLLGPVDMILEPGTVTSIIGRNGCGKSTLLRTACRLQPPISGKLVLDGEDAKGMEPKRWAQLVSVLPQVRQIPAISVHSLVMHGRFPHLGFSRKASKYDHEMVDHALKRMKISGLSGKRMDELSGGERQKAYLAMLLAQDATYLFMDEPATFLDVEYRLEIMDLMRQLAHEGKCVVSVMHELSHALVASDKVCLIDNGSIAMYDTPQNVFDSGLIQQAFHVRATEVATCEGVQYLFY